MNAETKDSVRAILLIGFLVLLFVVGIMLSGCATYTIRGADDKIISKGESVGILRTMTVAEKYDKNTGKIVSRVISTESTTKDVLLGLNELIDTAVETYDKVKPTP